MRRASRVDRNQSEIVDAYRKVGCSVQSLAAIGKGVPDLLVCHIRVLYLVEVKDPTQPKCKQALKPDQKTFHETWRGPIHIVHSVDEALAVIFRKCGHSVTETCRAACFE